MPDLSPTGVTTRALPRPSGRSVGFALVALGALLLPTASLAVPTTACRSTPWLGTPVGVVLSGLVLLAGVALVVEIPRSSAVAPALAIGAGLPLFGGALGSVVWLMTASCAPSVLDTPSGLLVVQAGASLAVLVTSCWLLYARDELEPWEGTKGVVAATGFAVAVLTVGVGVVAVSASSSSQDASALTALLTCPVPWAAAVALTGWLRRSPSIAVLVGAGLQLCAVIVGVIG